MENNDSPVSSEATLKRFSAIEGWRDIRFSIYAAAGTGLRIIFSGSQFDVEQYHQDYTLPTRQSAWLRPSRVEITAGEEQVLAVHTSPGLRNPFDDTYALAPDEKAGEGSLEVRDLSDSPKHTQNTLSYAQAAVERPYHVFSPKNKWLVVVIIGVAGLFSGLSSNIYFPALDAIAKDLNVGLDTVSLTITSYLIIQGISPLFWGSISDTLGRRPIYIASFIVYILANVGLSYSPNFAVLLIFRGLQAAGSASTVSIGNGVIQDITPPSERGAFISFYQAIRNFSIAVGPVLGGLLANFLGFRSIFLFLLILSLLVLAIIIIFLPETMRSIAGNGSLRLTGIYQPLIAKVGKEPQYLEDPEAPLQRKKVTIRTVITPLKLLLERDIFLNLVFGGLIYAIWSMVTSSTTGLFKTTFGLSELLLGLAFLPNGFGTIVGSAIIGRLMTKDYHAAEAAYKASHSLPPEYKLPAGDIPGDFPIEHIRLRHLPWISAVFAVSTALYGLSLASPSATSLHGWIAVPLFLQFLIAATSNAVFALNQTLVSDLCPGKGASATALNNLVRCGLGAVGVAFVQTMIAVLGTFPTFLGLALFVVIFMPLATVNWYWGSGWRVSRSKRQALLKR